MAETWTASWKSYLCKVNGELASILLDLGLGSVSPIASKPVLLWVWIYFQSPRTDGLSDDGEAPTLFKIEDSLKECLAHECQAILSGRITTQGRREFYFYGEKREGFRNSVEAALKDFEGYKFDLGDEDDPGWEQYINVLYPSPEDLQRIANMDLLDVLKKNGDVHTVAREVQHWLYFGSDSSRAHFRDAVAGSDFNIDSEYMSEGQLPYCIVVPRTQSVEQSAIDSTVIELLQLAQEFGGEYDGWETPIIPQ